MEAVRGIVLSYSDIFSRRKKKLKAKTQGRKLPERVKKVEPEKKKVTNAVFKIRLSRGLNAGPPAF